KTASSTPTGARAGWKAEATIGAEAAPPIFAWLPTAMKKKGALTSLATINKIKTWIRIQIKPIRKKPGCSKMAKTFIFITMVATNIYKKRLPTFEADRKSVV